MTRLQTARPLVRPPGPVAVAVILAAVEATALAGQWHVMRSWPSSVEAVDGAWPLLSLVVVGCAAAAAVQQRRHRTMTAAPPVSGARTVAEAGVVVGLLAVIVHALAVAAVVLRGWAVGLPGQPRLWPVLGVLAGLWFCAMLGTAVARLVATSLAPLVAMGVWVGGLLAARALGGHDLVDLGGASLVVVGTAPDTGAVLWRAAWLLAAGAVLWLVAAHGWRALRRPRFAVLVPAAAALAVATVTTAGPGSARVPVVWVCEPGTPEVCVAAEYEDRLPAYAAALARMAPIAAQVGLPQPAEGYHQSVGGPPRPGSFTVDPDVDHRQLAFDLITSSLPCSDQWELEDLRQADRVAAWMVTQAGRPPPPRFRVPDLAGAQLALSSLRCQR